jgi:hypothetical protein
LAVVVDGAVNRADAAWVPAQIRWTPAGPFVDWCHLGELRFTDPFFAYTVRRAMAHPFNLLFRRTTPLAALEDEPIELRLGGLIFHTTHCGSTLIARMLASVPGNVVLSEPNPISQILRVAAQPACAADEPVRWLRAILAALGRRRSAEDRDLFVKLEGWNALLLPLIRRAFPDVPWIFVYREPVEVLFAMAQAFPATEPWLLGLTGEEAAEMSTERYCAEILQRICSSAIEHYGSECRLVEYRELPQAVFTQLPEHFGLRYGADQLARMRETARFDAKQPERPFAADSEAKRRNASAEIRDLAASLLVPLYARLEALRLGESASSSGASIGA